MDFVVVGFGLGALSILLGVLMHGVLARRWARTAARATTADDRRYDLAIAAWRRDAGQALIAAGSALLIATVAALAARLDDRIGAFLVTTTATVAALGLLLWGFLYRMRHPAPARRRPRPDAVNQFETATVPLRAPRPAPREEAGVSTLNGASNGVDDHPPDGDALRMVPLHAVDDGGDLPVEAAETESEPEPLMTGSANVPVEGPGAVVNDEAAPAAALVPGAAEATVTVSLHNTGDADDSD